MISFLVRMRFEEADHDLIREHLAALAEASRREPGCVSYVPHFLAEDPCTIVLYEQYRDDAALEHHRNSPHFHQHVIGGLYQRMRSREVESLQAVA